MFRKGNIPWNKGKINPYSREVSEKHSKSMKNKWKNLEYREKQKETRKSEKYKIKSKESKIGEKNPNYGKPIHNNTKKSLLITIDKIKKRYPIFYSLENPVERGGKIFVSCKFCGVLFSPTHTQLYERIRHLERRNGNKKSFMYCCDDHKYKCPLSNRVNPEDLTEYKKYYRKVLKETNISIKNNIDKVNYIELRGTKYGYQLDHKYSIKKGFINNIDPKIIGHWKNLEILFWLDNIQKKINCSIDLDVLMNEIKKVK